MIKLLFFAAYREQLQTDSEEMDIQGLTDVASLQDRLRSRGGVWGRIFAKDQTLMVALNQEMVGENAGLNDGDEVAFFPPVTGG